MSWWDTGLGDDVIGDETADIVRRTLREVVARRTASGAAKPALADLLRGIRLAANGPAGAEALGHSGLREVVAILTSGQLVASGRPADDPGVRDLADALIESLTALRGVYIERWNRPPRVSEWLESLAFVLRYRPEEFLSDGVEHPTSSFKAT